MTNMEKANDMLEKNPELMEKVNAEVKRLANAKEAATPEEAMAKAIKTVLDIEVAEDEFKAPAEDAPKAPTDGAQKMSLDELDDVAGGATTTHGASSPDDLDVKILETVLKPIGIIGEGITKACCFFGKHEWSYGTTKWYNGKCVWWERKCNNCGKYETGKDD